MSPTLELQGAIVAALKADGAVSAMVSGRVFDPVPATAVKPYISIGSTDEIQDDAECLEAVTVTMSVNIWSEKPGFAEANKVAAAVRDALHRASLTFVTNALVEIEHRQTRRRIEPDGRTARAEVEFVATIEIH